MAKIQVSKVVDDLFGNCVKITNGIIEVMVTIDFGPRVIHCAVCGKENIFYQDKDKTSLGEVQECYGGDIIRLYGGHRVWISPEEMPRCYYPDNAPVSYKEIENGAIFTAPVEKINYIQKSITIKMAEDEPVIMVDNNVKNLGVWDIELAVWSITQMDKGGIEIIPQTKRETGYLHNRSFVLWPYSVMNDERIYWGKDFLTLKQDEKADGPFKVGLNNENGWGAYFNKGQVFLKFFDPDINGEFYPDNGCCYETYTNEKMLEAECLSQFVVLKPGEDISLNEEWELYEENRVPSGKDEDEIREIMKKYVEFD